MSRKAGRNTTVLSVRIPIEMYDKIKQYANKRKLTVNDWTKLILANASKYPIAIDEPIEQNEPEQSTALLVIKESSDERIPMPTL